MKADVSFLLPLRSHGNVKAVLLALVFDVAEALVVDIAENLAQDGA